jgi:endonuclease/exonuclease/phosphatase family metal-dependent hydrolase
MRQRRRLHLAQQSHSWGVPVPPWFVRIDYLFTAGEIVCLDASVGPWDGVSDHRAVVATLVVGWFD